MSRRRAASFLAVIVAGILIGSFLPWRTKIQLGTVRRSVVVALPGFSLDINVHRLLHVFAFGAAAWLAMHLAQRWRVRILWVLLVCAMALVVEAGETLIFHNRMEWLDVGDDLLGIGMALLLSVLSLRRSGSASPAASEK